MKLWYGTSVSKGNRRDTKLQPATVCKTPERPQYTPYLFFKELLSPSRAFSLSLSPPLYPTYTCTHRDLDTPPLFGYAALRMWIHRLFGNYSVVCTYMPSVFVL